MDQKESLLYLTTKQFNLTEDEAKTLLFDGEELKENAVDILLEKDKERVDNLRKQREEKYNEGYQTAEKKFKSHAEETFKKLTGYKGTEAKFEDMFQIWYDDQKKKLQAKHEVTDDDVKKHPLFIQLETQTISKEKYDELQRSFDEFKTTQQRQQVMGVVTEQAWSLVAAKEPILEQNEKVAANRRRDFLAKFSAYDYDLQDGKIIVIKEGKRIEDAHGNLITFDAFVDGLAGDYFVFRAQSDKRNVGNAEGGEDGTVLTDKPTTAKEYHAALDKWNGSSEVHRKMRVALKDYYYKNKKD
jgi:hypothetical protein